MYAMLLSNFEIHVLPEIHTVEKCDFLKSIIHSQIIQFSVNIICSVKLYNYPVYNLSCLFLWRT